MSDLAAKWFDGHDLSLYGLATSEVSGIFAVAGYEVARMRLPGRDVPADRGLYGALQPVVWKCVVAGDTHEGLLSQLRALRGILQPRKGFCELRVENRPGERTFARCLGWPVDINSLPYHQTVVEFALTFERLPYWEDLTEQVTTAAEIHNTGDLEAFPRYTCTFDAVHPLGFWFSVNGRTFTYTGVRVPDDAVVVDTDLADVLSNGSRDFAHTHQDSEFPVLDVGLNIVLTSSAHVLVSVAYRRRYL